MDYPLMQCGHTANGKDGEGNPVCVICAGISKGFNVVVEKPDLAGRQAICPSCKVVVNSKWSLAFFNYRPSERFDEFYCGCRGWN